MLAAGIVINQEQPEHVAKNWVRRDLLTHRPRPNVPLAKFLYQDLCPVKPIELNLYDGGVNHNI